MNGLGPCGDDLRVALLLTLRLHCRGVPKKEFEGLERTLIVSEEVVIVRCCTVVDNEIATRFAANGQLITWCIPKSSCKRCKPFTFLARVWPFDPNGILRRKERKKLDLTLLRAFLL